VKKIHLPRGPPPRKKGRQTPPVFLWVKPNAASYFGMERAITVDLAEGRGSAIIRGGRIMAVVAMPSARQESGRSDARIDEAAPGVIGADVALLVDFVLGGLFFFAFLASPARDVVEPPRWRVRAPRNEDWRGSPRPKKETAFIPRNRRSPNPDGLSCLGEERRPLRS
jgi:hypothetical protein